MLVGPPGNCPVYPCVKTALITLCDKVCQWLATGQWFSPGTPVYSTNITEILLKVALNTITLPYPKKKKLYIKNFEEI